MSTQNLPSFSSSFPFLTDPYGVGFERSHLITVIRAAARTSLCQTIVLIMLHIQQEIHFQESEKYTSKNQRNTLSRVREIHFQELKLNLFLFFTEESSSTWSNCWPHFLLVLGCPLSKITSPRLNENINCLDIEREMSLPAHIMSSQYLESVHWREY